MTSNLKPNPNPEEPVKSIAILCLLAFIGIFLMCQRCSAQTTTQIDTMYCNPSCIEKFIETSTANGKSIRIYAVYNDAKNDVCDLIPVSKTVYQYIQECKSNRIIPSLGIRLRNGQITSIIRYRPKYIKKHGNKN